MGFVRSRGPGGSSDKGGNEGSNGNSGGNGNGSSSSGSNGNGNGGHGNSNGPKGGNSNAPTEPIDLTESDLPKFDVPPNSKVNLVNDMAPTVSYSADWDFFFINQQNKPPPGHTFHSTARQNASLFFPFSGNQIYVIGILPPGNEPVSANYSIDGGPPQSKQLEASTGVNSFIGNETLFTSEYLPSGTHNISIVVTQTGNGRNYTLDNFYVIQSPPPQSDAKTQKSSSSGKNNTGAIVGGVLGAFAFFLLLAILFFLWRRRRMGQSSFQREHPQMLYYGQSSLGDAEPRNIYPYPFAPAWDNHTTSQSRRSWPTIESNRFPPPSVNPPSIAPSALDDRKSLASMRSIDSAGSWRNDSSTKNSSLEAAVSHFSLYSSRKTVSTMQFSEPTPPPRPRVPPTLQPLEPVPQGDFDRFTTASSVRALGHAL